MKYISIVFILLFVIISTDSDAKTDRSQYYSYGKGFYYQTFLQEHPSKDSVNVILQFRIVYDAVSFKKDNELSAFVGTPEIEIVFKNSEKIIKSRKIWRDTLILKKYIETNAKDKYIQGAISVDLPKSNYSINIELTSQTNKRLRDYVINMPTMSEDTSIIDMMFLVSNPQNIGVQQSEILNDNLSFSDSNLFLLLSTKDKKKLNDVKYRLKKVNSEKDDWTSDFWIGEKNISGNVILLNDKRVELIAKELHISNQSGMNLLAIDLRSKGLVPGEYSVEIIENGKEIFNEVFFVKWYDKPYSLREIDYAMAPMKYILTPDEHDLMYEGSDNEVWKKFLKYWNKIDPDPNTQFNEIMSEFYKRVDHTFFNYQTINARDGSKTDRGKVYILNGEPTNINRTMSTGITKETWVYENIKKIFKFESKTTGIYKLVKVKNIN